MQSRPEEIKDQTSKIKTTDQNSKRPIAGGDTTILIFAS
jgi:hypothetical protein